MAKFVIKNPPTEMMEPFGYILFTEISSASATRLVTENSSGSEIIYHGRDFVLDGEVATAGMVTSIDFYIGGELVAQITSGRFELSKLDLGNSHNNLVYLTRANDTVIGSNIADYILLEHNKGDDVVKGMGGDDRITGSLGSNEIDGGSGRDILTYAETYGVKRGIDVNLDTGRVVNQFKKIDKIENIEVVYGTALDDVFKGSKRNDSFGGAQGDDSLTGRGGADQFEIYSYRTYGEPAGRDTITDFGVGNDTILLGGFAEIQDFSAVKARMTQKGGDLLIKLAAGEEILLLDTRKSELKASDFDFMTL